MLHWFLILTWSHKPVGCFTIRYVLFNPVCPILNRVIIPSILLFPLHTLLLPIFSCMDSCYFPIPITLPLLYYILLLIQQQEPDIRHDRKKSHIWAFLAGAMAAYIVCERLAWRWLCSVNYRFLDVFNPWSRRMSGGLERIYFWKCQKLSASNRSVKPPPNRNHLARR